MKLWTIQLAKHRLLNGTGIELINTTLGSGEHWLAPSPLLLSRYKGRLCTADEYRVEYRRLLQARYRENKRRFHRIAEKPMVAFACYCPPDAFCHRLELVEPFEGICRGLGIAFEYCGEVVV